MTYTPPPTIWLYEALRELGATCQAHCDSLVLHAPGECYYCDGHSQVQELRRRLGIPFSGQPGAPDALLRSDDTIRRWSGNTPVKRGHLHYHLGTSFLVGADE